MEYSVPLDFSNFELEVTNRCNLACPRCSRTDFINQFPKAWKHYDLNLEDFKKFINPVLEKIQIFEFKGTMGDPIFHPNFLDWIAWIKSLNKKIFIHTNAQIGKSFWQKLVTYLDKNDKIIVGIDGIPTNFMLYRVNARWKNIEDCANILKGKTNLVWQYIVFSYNENNIDEAKQLSIDLGFDSFLLEHSDRWEGNNDWLKPNNALPIPNENQEIDPLCFKQPTHIVTADGFYMPCCMLIDHRYRYKTPWGKAFDIKKYTIDDVIKSSVATDFFAKLTNESAPNYCRFNCGKC